MLEEHVDELGPGQQGDLLECRLDPLDDLLRLGQLHESGTELVAVLADCDALPQ